MMNISIEEFPPCPLLSPYIHTYWKASFNINALPDFTQSVVPNGYVELIIHLGDDHCVLGGKDDKTGPSPDYTIIGLHTSQYEVRFDQTVSVFGIRFYPDGLSSIFGLTPSAIVSTYADTTDLPGTVVNDFCHRIRSCRDSASRVSLADSMLSKQLASHANKFDYTTLAARIVRQHAGLITQKDLMREVPISSRQLQRGFKDRFGITTKEYMRIARLNAVQRYMRSKSSIDFAAVAYNNGFSDQSHFIREFKAFTGIAPRRFMRSGKRYIVNM